MNNFPYTQNLTERISRIKKETINFYSNPLNIELKRIKDKTENFWSDNISINIGRIKARFYYEFHPTYFIVLEFLNSNGGLL